MSEINLYYQLNIAHIAKEKFGGFAARDTNGKVVLMLAVEETAVHIVLGENPKYNPIATWHYSADNFATISATKILIKEIMCGKSLTKLPFRIIFRA